MIVGAGQSNFAAEELTSVQILSVHVTKAMQERLCSMQGNTESISQHSVLSSGVVINA